MMSVCQEARLALVPDWPCLYCTVLCYRRDGGVGGDRDDETTAGGSTLVPWALGRRPADGKFEKPALHATHMIWPKVCSWKEVSEAGREYSNLPFKRVH
jgi:hypothetical protein